MCVINIYTFSKAAHLYTKKSLLLKCDLTEWYIEICRKTKW